MIKKIAEADAGDAGNKKKKSGRREITTYWLHVGGTGRRLHNGARRGSVATVLPARDGGGFQSCC